MKINEPGFPESTAETEETAAETERHEETDVNPSEEIVSQASDVISQMPETVDQVSENLDQVPEIVGQVSETVDRVPEIAGQVSETVDHALETAGQAAEEVNQTPTSVSQMPNQAGREPDTAASAPDEQSAKAPSMSEMAANPPVHPASSVPLASDSYGTAPQQPLPPAVMCYGLTKTYGSFPALTDLTLELPAGKIIGLLGPNGSGKTTLMKILAGLLVPTSGEARIAGKTPGVETKSIVSYLPERMYFDPGLKVEACIHMFRDFYADFDEKRARDMLGVLNVPTDRKLKSLSKGTKEKVQLVLVMARRAKLYLLDEPIGGVDPAARDFILSTIVAAHEPGATVVISTHLIQDVEPILDGFVFLGGGRSIMSGDAETVRRSTGKTLDELFREVFRCY